MAGLTGQIPLSCFLRDLTVSMAQLTMYLILEISLRAITNLSVKGVEIALLYISVINSKGLWKNSYLLMSA